MFQLLKLKFGFFLKFYQLNLLYVKILWEFKVFILQSAHEGKYVVFGVVNLQANQTLK